MVEAGVLAADERVELIEGQLFEMAAKGTAHSAAVTRIDRVLSRRLEGLALIRWQDPVQLSDRSEPEPDVAIVAFDPFDYEEHHPTAAEIFWLIEVADTTLKRDLELKTPMYARSGVREYWILDLNDRCLHVFRHPVEGNYAHAQIVKEDETISPLAFPQCVVRVSEFLRPIGL